MFHILNKRRAGLTLIEIMIVVSIIALVAAMAVPNILRARKRSQATRILADLRIVDAAMDLYAIETNKGKDAPAEWADLQPYLKTNTVIYNSGGSGRAGQSVRGLLGGCYSQAERDEFWQTLRCGAGGVLVAVLSVI